VVNQLQNIGVVKTIRINLKHLGYAVEKLMDSVTDQPNDDKLTDCSGK
jgi:hypothetical protein